MLGSPAIQDVEKQFEANCKGKTFCTIQDLDYAKLNGPCIDEILKRGLASKYDTLAGSLDPTKPHPGTFDVSKLVDTPHRYDPTVPEPLLYIIGYCDDTDFVIRDTDITLTKDQLSTVLVSFDVFTIIILIIGFNIISYMQKDYIYEFSKTTVGVRDFTLVINKLPNSFRQYKDELSLKYAIWS